jgi:four helix bundle protein
MAEIRDFQDLIVWQKAIKLASQIYNLTVRFPKEERFGLTNQLRRAAVSVSSNIAEGHARQGREFAHFLSIARGSLAETQSQLLLAVELQFATEDAIAPTMELTVEIRRMIATLSAKLD